MLLVALAGAQPADAALTLTDVGGEFTNPVFVAAPPGDGERLMVVEIAGSIRVVKNGGTLEEPFLTIPDVDTTREGGLLSMAFPPDYRTSGRFYVFVVSDDADPGPDPPHGPIEIREYRRSPGNPDVADPASKRTVLTIPHPDHATHYAGTLQFGPDGLLYASVGDGGGGGDPGDDAQNTSSRLGKLLRFDPRPFGSAPYLVPGDNPFVGGGGDPLVYSYGLRNPFRFSFDRANGNLTIGDVGQDKWEEIDFVPHGDGRGANFGWVRCEGMVQRPDDTQACTTGTPPVHVYPHPPEPSCASVTGGVVVRDAGLEELAGKYLFGDYCATYVKSLTLPGASEETLSVAVPPFALVGFGEDACGRVHLALLGHPGKVQRLGDDTPGTCDLRVNYSSPSPAQPGQPAAKADLPALVFTVGGALRQRSLRSGRVSVRVRCSTACRARVLGQLSLRRKGTSIRLRQARGRRSAAGTLTLRLALSPGGRRAVRRALRARRRVRAALTVRVRDSAGKLSIRRRTVRLVR